MIRIYDYKSRSSLKAAVLVSTLLLLAAVASFGQQVVNLTAGPTTTTMPDGTVIPMWGYTCGAVVSGSSATCAPLAGSSSAAATGSLGGIYVLNGGSGYTAPTVTISGGGGTGATASAVVNGGKIVGFNITNHGSGYTSAPTVSFSGDGGSGAVAAASPAWSPVVITVPYGKTAGGLTINLTNNLSFTTTDGSSTTNIPTSVVIIGQVGGGLGLSHTVTTSPDHSNAQGCASWFIASGATPPGTPCTAQQTGASGTPPTQGPRVQSMATEVTPSSTATSLTWPLLKPGTYLLESGTHPSIQVPMGLVGMLVVTQAPVSGTSAGTAYPAFTTPTAASQTAVPNAITYNAEVPLEFSEIDPVQNKAVDLAVRTTGFSETAVWSGMNYNDVNGITVTNGGSGYTSAPSVSISGGGGNGATATATIANGVVTSITLTSGGGGYTSTPTVLISGGGGTGAAATATVLLAGCGATHTCYPPAVNYTPFYFLINGRAFDKTNPALSLFPASAGGATSGITGNVLVRLVNAGLRMHVPSIVGSQTTGFNGAGASSPVNGFTVIAEDGNPVPDILAPRVKTEVFMAAGKTYDVMINAPPSATTPPSLPVFDREGSLSANSSVRDAGMLAYIGVNGSTLPATTGGTSGVFSAAQANPDTYSSLVPCGASATTCIPLVISDPSKGLIANDVNVYGVQLSTAPANGTLTCNALAGSPVAGICANGTFTYTPNPGTGMSGGVPLTAGAQVDTFGYCANGSAGLCTTVTLNLSSLKGSPTAANITYTSKMATYLKIPSPGVLSVDSDPNGLPLTVVASSASQPANATITMDAAGGFSAAVSGTGNTTCPTTAPSGSNCFQFTYTAQNSQGSQSGPATVTLIFPPPSNLQVKVLDAQAYKNCNGNSACIAGLTQITDYRWIIEEDKTFYVDPNCTTNSSAGTPGCMNPANAGETNPTFGVQFHTSNMDFVAQGCTGSNSCEGGQTMLDTNPSSSTYGQHIAAVCDLGNGACRPDPTGGNGTTQVQPSQVVLDPSKRYYISILPGDAANPFPAYAGQPSCDPTTGANPGDGACGHTMSGAEIPAACNVLGGPNACTSSSAFTQPVNVLVLPTPLPTGKLSVLVFEDDFPLNGEQDGGGGGGTVAPVEPGLGGFNIVLWDTYGGLGDVTGQNTYDMFNEPLSNSLAGTIDPTTNMDACPISATPDQATGAGGLITGNGAGPAPATAMTGMIVTCPKYEADGATLSPLAGQAVIVNLMPEKFSVQAYPGADRIARGEEWLQTNTLDGQHPHDAFIEIGDPSYFQEYGPAGYHVMIGFANPAIINSRLTDVCNGFGSPGTVGPCTNSIDGQVDVERLSRTPDQRLYPSGSRDAFAWTQCWVSLGDPDGEDFMFTKCDANGNFKFNGVPSGNWRLTIGDEWNDQIIDGLSTPANVGCTTYSGQNGNSGCQGGQALHMGNVGVQQWQSNLYTKTCIDDNKNGVCDPDEIGIPMIYTMIHYRDGHNANSLTTDFNGVANFNESFPLFNWYVVEADTTRYKTTGIHTIYDAGGPADGSPSCGPTNGARACGGSSAYNFFTNTYETLPLPTDLSVPGAVYCKNADCVSGNDEADKDFKTGIAVPSSTNASTGRIDPPYYWGGTEGWNGLTGQSNWMEIGKAPYASCNPALPASSTNFCTAVKTTPAGSTTSTTTQVGENGGIYGNVSYASTRPFDDASQMIQQPWEPNVPGVTMNLYQEGFAADGVTKVLNLVDTTTTSSWDQWAQGFYPGYTDPVTGTPMPYMNCPGQGTGTTGAPNQDVFFFTLFDQPNYLDWYSSVHTGSTVHQFPYNSQFKCYDSMHIGNQLQPAPYDGKYQFPSSLGINPTTGKLVSTVGTTNGVTASMAGTNCTVCVPNPDSTDPYRYGTPMLPPGKYVVEVIMPPGYEVYKEEDKNLLIGDNFVAPVTQQFGGLGTDIFILPDQASVASMYDESNAGYNPNNFQDQTTGLGLADELSGVPGFPGYTDPVWPCVGEMRVVPDYLSLFPQNQEVAPFAGAVRPLCDRKEVTLNNQMAANARFFIFTSTHIAGKYTGVITDDFTAEFDPFAPQFGEKFGPPNMPVSTKDYLGNELSRVYSDHWGAYDGLTFSSWDVNPPNITGYSPAMMTQCMNDPGPIPDGKGGLMQDPLYTPAYSDFCYINPFMPGLTTYNDTPVVPTEGFVGAAYNNPDCSYPDTTPAVSEVDGDGVGPWVSQAGNTLIIKSLGDQQVSNSAYAGPSAVVAPFNQKTITRHYGFGSQCTTVGANGCTAVSSVTIGGQTAAITSWSDTSIQVTVPATGTAANQIHPCTLQQQSQYATKNGSTPPNFYGTAYCGELVITAGNGKQSIDAVTVTVGGKAPTHVNANQTIQSAIDQAAPGDLIIVDPTCNAAGVSATCSASALNGSSPSQTASQAAHNEMLLMWKPVRLQGVGAPSSIIDASAFPAGQLLDPWRRHINCLFGLTLSGVPFSVNPVYDSSGAGYTCPDATGGWMYYGTDLTGQGNGTPVANVPQIDRIPLEAVVGWDATLNGNLAEQLQEPSLMGAYEGAVITVLSKGVYTDPTTPSFGTEGAFPTGALLLQDTGAVYDETGAQVGPQNSYCFTIDPKTHLSTTTENVPNPYPSNYECNPSSIDGLTVRDSSQGGGGVMVHGWAHNLQIANNRIYNNAGTLSGGITLGQGEFPDPITVAGVVNGVGEETIADVLPSCQDSTVVGTHLPWCLNVNVNMHNNDITANSSLGDELFSGTLAGGGGASFCSGSDYYAFQYNWVCGNISSAEGGGISHLGFSYNGDIEHNTIALNQSTNPTIPTNGGGLIIMGTPDTDPTCTTIPDADCPPGLSDGTGPNLIVNANLIQANASDSGSGGGIRLQQVNGTDVSTFNRQPQYWNSVSITNNIINNNVAGWDGAGISLQDSLNVTIINNTIANNDSLASSGVLTQSIGTPMASAPPGNCVNAAGTASCPQSAGVTSTPNSGLLTTTFVVPITCPHSMPNCTAYSNPILSNNIIWHNRSFFIGIGNLGQGTGNQQKLISLFNMNGTPAPTQTSNGECTENVSYWDLGVRGDTGPSNHTGNMKLNPTYSMIDDPSDYSNAHNMGSNPNVVSQYCNGSRVPPNCSVADGCGGPSGYGVPPGVVDASAPNPVFSLTPSATVDEGNNWINVSWGPLSLSDDSVMGGTLGNYGGGGTFANYMLTAGSPAIDQAPKSSIAGIPSLQKDFFGNPRPDISSTASGNGGTAENTVDIGAVEYQDSKVTPAFQVVSITPPYGHPAATGWTEQIGVLGLAATPTPTITVTGGITTSGTVISSDQLVTTQFAIPATNAWGTQTVTVTQGANHGTISFIVSNLSSISPSTATPGSTVNVTFTGAGLTGATGVGGFGNQVTVSNFTVLTDTTATATFTFAQAATGGVKNLYLTFAANSNTNTVPFTVIGPGLNSVTPVSGYPGTSVPVTFSGSGLTGATGIGGFGNAITYSGFTVVNDSTVTATVNIGTTATLGAKNIYLNLPSGPTGTVVFTVSTPTITAVNPTSALLGTQLPITFTGNGLVGTTAINGLGTGVTVSNLTANAAGTSVTATLAISTTATTGAHTLTLTTPSATTNGVTFTISRPTPALTSLSPNSGYPGEHIPVTFTGSGLTTATGVGGFGNAVTVSGFTVVSDTSVTATINLPTNAALGAHNIYLTTPFGNTNTETFTTSTPSISSVSPSTADLGVQNLPVTFTGIGLSGATGVMGFGGNVTVSILSATDTTVTARLTIGANTTIGTHTVGVVVPSLPNTGTNGLPFNIVRPNVTTVSPASAYPGETVPVTFTGSGLAGVTGISGFGNAITYSNLVATDTQVTATINIPTNATVGTKTLRLTIPGGSNGSNSNTINFQVLTPTISNVNPNSVTHSTTTPTVLNVTFTGTGLSGATGINGFGNRVTVNITSTSDTSVSATLTFATNVMTGAKSLQLVVPSGMSTVIPFTVN